MLKSHEKFHSTNGKRLILIADDEMINRSLLGEMLKDEYEVIYACDGGETINQIKANKETLSLVLLDLMMPVLNGMDVLKQVKADKEVSSIPIIVLTSEQEAEVESLNIGAADFIPKPYPAVDIIKARILRTIELSEDRDIINSTERDSLTGLYNREYFYRYAKQYDQFHKETVMDAVIVDVNHFHMINERYGRTYGDEILKRIAEKVREMVLESGGIVCRREADTFMIYCPHRDDYNTILENASIELNEGGSGNSRVRIRMGVYYNVDKEIDIERRFDRAKMAADSVQGSFTKTIGVYDKRLHEIELYEEQLIEDFNRAIREKQFQVYYQPKFDIRPDTPLLSSAEALVRWIHPDLGMISPGVFIPLFEENGLIQKLDNYVWEETANQIRDWRERFGYYVPVSVNVSRIDMYDPNLLEKIKGIVKKNDLSCSDFMLEVTESAYTEDSEQIIETVNKMRDAGFIIEMDDFGTGYSSLNMISSLPIDALKLDMHFIRDAFKEGGTTHMLEVIIEIAEFLDVPVIAEGVETEEQMNALKALGCAMVQGYFFSKPVPAYEFEAFILQKKEADKNGVRMEGPDSETILKAAQLDAIRADVKKDTEEKAEYDKAIAEVFPDQKSQDAGEQEVKEAEPAAGSTEVSQDASKRRGGLQLRTANIFFTLFAFVAAAALLFADIFVARGYTRMEQASDRYIAAQRAATDMESGSDYLTDRVRCFVVTGEIEYLNDFTEEVYITKTRDNAVINLEKLLEGRDNSALESLNVALRLSNELIETEYLAMHLVLETSDYDTEAIPEDILNTAIPDRYQDMTDEEKNKTAEDLVFNSAYMHYKDRIRENVNACTQALIYSSSQELERASARLSMFVNLQTVLTILFMVIFLVFIVLISRLVRKPLSHMVDHMKKQEVIPPTGVEELQYVTQTYNSILEENRLAREKLSHEASHDALTGLFNRGAYDMLMESVDREHMALIIVDVDHFKEVNDTYGHDVGDRILKRVADVLRHSFRSVDIICRFGGDEFVVVMTRSNSSMSQLVLNKIEQANHLLQNPKDGLPPVSLSVGVAFSDRPNPQGDIFKDADTALYRVKEAGRNGCKIYE